MTNANTAASRRFRAKRKDAGYKRLELYLPAALIPRVREYVAGLLRGKK